jgi:hypothetical protein
MQCNAIGRHELPAWNEQSYFYFSSNTGYYRVDFFAGLIRRVLKNKKPVCKRPAFRLRCGALDLMPGSAGRFG